MSREQEARNAMISSTGFDRLGGPVSAARLVSQESRAVAGLFALIHDDAFYDRPIPLRHPFAFYEGHIRRLAI